MPKKVGAVTVPRAGKPDDRTAPYTVPMKAVPHKCGSLRAIPSSTFGSPRCAWILPPACSCARGVLLRLSCAVTVTVATATVAGHAGARHESACRYQRSWRGRLAHAGRSRRWRQRHGAGDDSGEREHNVTHQGCPPGPAAASLVACTSDTLPVSAISLECRPPSAWNGVRDRVEYPPSRPC